MAEIGHILCGSFYSKNQFPDTKFKPAQIGSIMICGASNVMLYSTGSLHHF
jgi:hypothetical protein